MKKILALVLSLVFIVSLFATAYADDVTIEFFCVKDKFDGVALVNN